MPFKLVVFDFDGTLVDSLLTALDIFNRFAAKYRYKPIENPEAVRSMTTRQFMKHHGISLWRLPRLVRKFHAAVAGEAEKLKLYPGLVEVLAGLQESGTRLGILSSNKEDNIRRCLRVNGAEEFFAFVVGYPKLFGKGRALRRIVRAERIARGDVLYVGDELRDMEAAQGRCGVCRGDVGLPCRADIARFRAGSRRDRSRETTGCGPHGERDARFRGITIGRVARTRAMPSEPLLQSQVPGFACRRGKVRDVYDLGDTLAIVATDRISAFDWVMPNGIPDKGRVLTALSAFWFNWLKVPNHLLSTNLADLPPAFQTDSTRRSDDARAQDAGGSDRVRRPRLPRGEWVEGVQGGRHGLRHSAAGRVARGEPVARADLHAGHQGRGRRTTRTSRSMRWRSRSGSRPRPNCGDRTLDVYRRAAAYAESRGIILADTKFEWGRLPSGELILIDEVLTPDSSRFWPEDTYRPGSSPPSFDKQFVRDWLETTGWDKKSPPPQLPAEVVEKTAAKYREALEKLTEDRGP